ncbi:hypothetical protein [Neorhodopirellula pilleata]|uniref:Uncharacterized protein n=1 Tax=Neorhodopirellula pilleata TaxID=2714738 RepID=A0A5C6AAQ0_9BACT|nr:hypothetical protein [Neorhodopirellula pilleata]TWT96388.1 hypothetical protein Pla100_28660 [Neorhodopirellula pilleata]
MPQPNHTNELEEFLRKTAEIRQRKTFAERVETEELRQNQTPKRPEYTNARRERMTDSDRFRHDEIDAVIIDADDDEDNIAIAVEIIDEDEPRLRSRDTPTIGHVHKEHGGPNALPTSQDVTIETLKAMLHSPTGLRQAFLIQEIFKRPF